MSSRPGATLLVGFDPRTALAVARPLSARGLAVYVATLTEWEIPIRSRAISGYAALSLNESPAAFRAALDAVIDQFQVDTVFPLTDRALAALSPHFEYLRGKLFLASPTPAQFALVLDKSATGAVADRLGIPVPGDFDAPPDGAGWPALRFPLFAKPRNKQNAGNPFDPALHFIRDLPELQRVARAQRGAGLLLQEFVPGDDVGLAVLMAQGRILRSFQYRAVRTYPAGGGVAVMTRSEPVDARLRACAEKLLRELNWEGVAQLDFRHDAGTGRFALLEVNGRFWGSSAVANRAGLDLPYAAWQLARGERPDAREGYREGMLVRWLEGDVRRVLRLGREISPGSARTSRAAAICALAWAFRPGVRGMVWSWRDPQPAWDMACKFVWCWGIARVQSAGRTLLRGWSAGPRAGRSHVPACSAAPVRVSPPKS